VKTIRDRGRGNAAAKLSAHAAAVLGASLLVFSGGLAGGQEPVRARSQGVMAWGIALGPWASRVDVMLGDGSLDFGRLQADTMIDGRVHERLGQYHDGLPVFGGQLVRQLDGRRTVSISGRYFDDIDIPTTDAGIAVGEASEVAERAAGLGARAEPPILGILPRGNRSVLVYRTTVRGPWDVRTYFVNASTGAVEDSASQIRHQETPAVGRGIGVLGDQKKVSSDELAGSFFAVDLLRPAVSVTFAFNGGEGRLNSFLESGLLFDSDIAESSSNTWGDSAVVDAHVYQGWVYDYYFKRFGRRGLDDANVELLSIVHPLARSQASLYPPELVGTFINNAAYLHPGLMFYGDGDGQAFDYFAGALDVIAHEMTHGVMSFTSDLVYRDESGALNEAFSDVMAVGAEFFHLSGRGGPQKGPNFLIGEDVTLVAPGFVRSLQNPSVVGDPDHYSLRQFIGTDIDDGGVHFNSAIVGHAFYLAVAGGTNRVSGISVQGVGIANIERMERIFYRAFTFHLTPLAQFSDARAATLLAAAELYGSGSPERVQLQRAWDAVGVQ